MNILRFFLCLLGISLLQTLPSQPLNRSLHRQPINLGDKLLATTINGAWLIGGSTGQYMGYPSFRPWLALADASGNLVWERYLDDAEAVELGQINSLSEDPLADVFYVVGSVSGCDYLIPGALYMLDKNGQTLWYKPSDPFYNPIGTALPLQGLLVGEKGLGAVEWHSMSGNVVVPVDFGAEFGLQLVEMITAGINTAALLGRNQLLLTQWADGEVQMASRIQLEGGRSISLASSGRLVVLAEEKVYLLDDSLSVLKEQNLSAYGSFGKVSCRDNRCYVAGQTPEGRYIALNLDAELNVLQTIAMGSGYNFPTDIAARETGLVALGNALPQPTETAPFVNQSLFSTSKGSDIFLLSWDESGNPAASQRDIVVERVAVGQREVGITPEGCLPFGGGYMQGNFSGVEVEVRNQGNVPIDRIELNTVFVPCWFICYTQQNFSRTFDGLSLMPGESTTLNFGDIQTFPLPLQNTLELCIWASGPDGWLDDDFSDNNACLSLVVSEKEEPVLGGIHLFPNPASDFLEIRFDTLLAAVVELKVLNALGQCLYREALSPGQSAVRLPVEQLPAGLYYLAVQMGQDLKTLPWAKR